jgi:hypothetical protein
MPSAVFCAVVRSPYDDLSPESGTQRRSPEVRPTAFAARPPDLPPRPLMVADFAIIGSLVQPGRPRIRFLSIGPRLCSTLPSDPASRRRPCASLILRHHQAGWRTSTPKLSIMLGTPKKPRTGRGQSWVSPKGGTPRVTSVSHSDAIACSRRRLWRWRAASRSRSIRNNHAGGVGRESPAMSGSRRLVVVAVTKTLAEAAEGAAFHRALEARSLTSNQSSDLPREETHFPFDEGAIDAVLPHQLFRGTVLDDLPSATTRRRNHSFTAARRSHWRRRCGASLRR